MNRISTLYGVLVLCVCLVCISCGGMKRNGKSERRIAVERKVRYFSQIEVEAPCNVYYVQSDSLCVRVHAEGDAVDAVSDIVTVHDGNKLVIRPKMFRRNLLSGNDMSGLDVYVYSPDLTDVMFKSSGTFKVLKPVDTDTLRVRLTGSGNVSFGRVMCDNLVVALEGSGNIDIDSVRGVTSYVSLLGAGNVNVRQYKFTDSRFRLMGVGDMNATLEDCNHVECELMGVGNMTLRGTARSLSQNKKGTGNINTDELKFSR